MSDVKRDAAGTNAIPLPATCTHGIPLPFIMGGTRCLLCEDEVLRTFVTCHVAGHVPVAEPLEFPMRGESRASMKLACCARCKFFYAI